MKNISMSMKFIVVCLVAALSLMAICIIVIFGGGDGNVGLVIGVGIAGVLTCSVVTALAIMSYKEPLGVLREFFNLAGETREFSINDEERALFEKFSVRKDEFGELFKNFHVLLQGIHEIAELLELFSGGNLEIDAKPRCEGDVLAHSLEKAVGGLNFAFSEIRDSAGKVANISTQIADGSQTLARGSTEQAASVQELNSSVTEILQMTNENTKISKKAAGLSGDIKQNAERGNAQMNQMMTAVREITDASSEIEKIIKIIDDIAFQTNILALNAAVEAARAGVHGKGFAVVAEEVRTLAAKSAEAAKNTGRLIANSVEKANLGMDIANQTSESLCEIVDGINKSAEIIAGIAKSSDEQSGAIEQLNFGIEQVSQVVQQNSATAEQSAAASQELSNQSKVMKEMVLRFRMRRAVDRDPSAVSIPPDGIERRRGSEGMRSGSIENAF